MTLGLDITAVHRTHMIERVFALALPGSGPRRFEFTRFAGGRTEVYDFPGDWGNLSRFVGYLPDETAAKLRELVAFAVNAGVSELWLDGALVARPTTAHLVRYA